MVGLGLAGNGEQEGGHRWSANNQLNVEVTPSSVAELVATKSWSGTPPPAPSPPSAHLGQPQLLRLKERLKPVKPHSHLGGEVREG